VVADALEIVGDLDRADDEPEIARHRLLERQQLHSCLFHFHLQRVELDVAVDHMVGFIAIPCQQRLDRKVGSLFGLDDMPSSVSLSEES
jgi:hypothetical protein